MIWLPFRQRLFPSILLRSTFWIRRLRTAATLAMVGLLLGIFGTAHAQDPVLVRESPNPAFGGFFGSSVSDIADVTGDNRSDIIVSAPKESERVYVFGGDHESVLQTLRPGALERGLPFSSSGDLDGDQVGDFLVSRTNTVVSYSGSNGEILHTFESPDPERVDQFGRAHAPIPDVNGDGIDDVLIGADKKNVGSTRAAGRVYLFGGNGGLLTSFDSPSPEQSGSFGRSVAGIGDVTGDGVPELAVGATWEANRSGRVHVFTANGGHLYTVESPNATSGGNFGFNVEGIADVSGNGFPDLVVGAYREDNRAGRAYVLEGEDGSVLHTLQSPSPEAGGEFGTTVRAFGDVTGDGTPEIAVGAPLETVGGNGGAGRAYLFNGSSGGLLREFTAPSPVFMGQFGVSLAGGNFLSENRPNLLIGEPLGGDDMSGVLYQYALGQQRIAGRVTLTETGQGFENVEVTLSGDASATTITDGEGRYSFGVADGSYTVAPSASKFNFDPERRAVTVSGNNLTGLNFDASLANPALTLDGFEIKFEDRGNGDGTANPGEFLSVQLSIANETGSAISGAYARMDRTADPYVHPIDEYFFDERVEANQELPAGEKTTFGDDFNFHVGGNAPDGHVLEVPLRLFNGNDEVIGVATLALPVRGSDTTPPEITGFDVDVQPGFVQSGNTTTISAFVTEGSPLSSVEAVIETQSGGQQVGTVTLRDDGSGADREAGDRRFTGAFTPQQEAEFVVNVSATDDKNNTGGFEGASFTSVPFSKSADVLLVADNRRSWTDDFEGDYTGALESTGFSADVWRVYQRGTPPVDLMRQYQVAVWYTGFQFRSLNEEERDAIAQHLGGGEKLLIAGEEIAESLDRDAPVWLEETLRATFVQDDVDRFAVEGVSGDPVSDGFAAGLNQEAFDADEIDPSSGGVQMLTYDDAATQPKSSARATVSTSEKGEEPAECSWRAEDRRPGCVDGPVVHKSGANGPLAGKAVQAGAKDVESSGTAGVRFAADESEEQLVYLAFGLEAVAESNRQIDLVRRVMSWLGLERRSISGRVTTVGTDRGVEGVTVALSGDASRTTTTDAEGRYSFLVEDGTYTVSPSESKHNFQPQERSGIHISGNSNGGLNFEASLADPALTLASSAVQFEFPGNGDGTVQAGEFLGVELTVENTTGSTITGAYALMDRTADDNVHPSGAYFFDRQVEASKELSANSTTPFGDNFDFHVGAGANGETLQVPIAFFNGNDQWVGQDVLTVSVEGPDETDPLVRGQDVHVQPGYVPSGNPTTITAFVTEAGFDPGASSGSPVTATVEKPNGQSETVDLFDDGGEESNNADETAGDRVFTAAFTPEQEGNYTVDISATDASGNTGGFEGASFTTLPFSKSADVLLVADDGRPWTGDIEPTYTGALQANGFTPDLWRVYQRGVPSVNLMGQYDATVWFTGPFRGIARAQERTRIAQYLNDEGGKLFIAGREIAEDLQRRDRSWLEQNLHATFVQPRVDRFEVNGVSEDPVSSGLTQLGLDSDGYDSDEVDPASGASSILHYDDGVTQPKAALSRGSEANLRRCSWRAKGRDDCEPTSEERAGAEQGTANAGPSAKDTESSGTAGLRFLGESQQTEDQQRLVFLAFGLEAINTTADRDQLVGSALDWLIPGAGCPLSWSLDVEGTANDNSQTLTLGQSRNATAGQDAACGEDELDSGPSGFDLRFTGTDLTDVDLGTNGGRTDIRPNFKRTGAPSKRTATSARATWRIDLQTASGAGTVSLFWDDASLQSDLPDRRVRLVDVGTGGNEVDVDMKQTGSVDVDVSTVDAVHVRLDPPVARSIPVSSSEWDVLSVPVQVEPQTFSAILGDACRSGFFLDPNSGYSTVGDSQILPVGRGGFFKCPSQTTVSVTGQTVARTVSVKAGWNIIGAFEEEVNVDNITTEPTDLLESKFFEYDGGFTEASTIKPGLGYWVKASSPGTIDLSGTSKSGETVAAATGGSQARAKEADGGAKESGLELILADRVGHQASLHLMETLSEEDRAQYLVPPVPPAEIFDVRFEGGYLAASLSETENHSDLHVLHVRGADFPVDLRLKGGNDEESSLEERALRVVANGQERRLTPESPTIELEEPTQQLKVGATTVPSDFALKKSRPNPVARRATIEYALPEKAKITLEVYDVLGRRVARLVDDTKRAGVHQTQLDADRLRSGVYFLRMRAGDFQKTGRMTVVR